MTWKILLLENAVGEILKKRVKAAAAKKGVTGCCLKGFFYRKSLLLTQQQKLQVTVTQGSFSKSEPFLDEVSN